MTYSRDLRQRVLDFVNSGGKRQDAARLYKINVDTITEWTKQSSDHQAKKPGPKDSRKFSRADLRQAVAEQPDLMLKELAQRFGVSVPTIGQTLALLNISRKKNTAI